MILQLFLTRFHIAVVSAVISYWFLIAFIAAECCEIYGLLVDNNECNINSESGFNKPFDWLRAVYI